MALLVVVGGQFGSEGKGKVAHYLARERGAIAVARVGGSNSGHTVLNAIGTPIIFRHLPTAAILPKTHCIIGAGSYIDPDLLLTEINYIELEPERVYLDPKALIIRRDDERTELTAGLRESIGSTISGTGAAIQRRINRGEDVKFVEDDPRLKPYIKPVVPKLREWLSQGETVILEGTQGYGLSLLHSPYYPYTTSRDTTAAAFVSELGLSPIDVSEIFLVLRSFPIRVAGNSGELPGEISWEILNKSLHSQKPIIEYSSVTNTIRRVAKFDPEIVRGAIASNHPTSIVMNHLDYVGSLYSSESVIDFLAEVEDAIDTPIEYLGNTPESSLFKRLSKFPRFLRPN